MMIEVMHAAVASILLGFGASSIAQTSKAPSDGYGSSETRAAGAAIG
jgi:hypothetical protein